MFLNPGEGGKGHVSEHLRAQAEDPRHHPQVSEQEKSQGTKRCIKKSSSTRVREVSRDGETSEGIDIRSSNNNINIKSNNIPHCPVSEQEKEGGNI